MNNNSEASELNKNKHNVIYNLSSCETKEFAAFCINFDKKYKINLNLLDKPYRIVVNFESLIQISKNSINKINIKTDLINQIRFGYPKKTISRLVFELDQPAIVSELFYKKDPKNKNNIVGFHVGISKTSKVGFEIAKHVLLQNNGNILDLNKNSKDIFDYEKEINILPKLRPKNDKKIKNNYIVFIDPGHGGRDPGAIGKLGTREKDIVLQASLELAKHLKKTNVITPILSRSTDVYIPLRQRINLAKINKADIFISLHADASKNRAANGVSVFSLSDKASDKEAKMIAERENAVDIIPGIQTHIKDPVIFGTLIKMFQRQAMNDSAFLARNIILTLEKTKLAINRGHRFAGFAVLKAHNIPSVLIEIGFISNLKEEKKMLNKQYLKNLSKNLTTAIKNYLLKQK